MAQDAHVNPHRPRRRRCKAEGTVLSHPVRPNDLWCADYKGEFVLADKRYCYPLTITDAANRYLLSFEALSVRGQRGGGVGKFMDYKPRDP